MTIRNTDAIVELECGNGDKQELLVGRTKT